MAKRFTATEKWTDKWFRGLSPNLKLGWSYLVDNCDSAGVIDLDRELADFQIGCPVDWDLLLESAGDRVAVIRKGKWFLTGFIQYQYGKLSPDCKPHIPIIQLLARHQIPLESVQQNETFKFGNVSDTKRAKVYERDDYTCLYCNEQFEKHDLEPDHLVPVSRGGNDSMGNLVTACRVCNRRKRDIELSEFIESLDDSEGVWERLFRRLPERLSQSLEEKEKDKDKEKDKEKYIGGCRGEKKFAPPSVEDVAAYCLERHNGIDPQAFVDHYEANGWMRGKTKLKNWKAAVRTWEQKRKTKPRLPTPEEDAEWTP